MGYGGTLSNAARVIGRSGDEGIDGIIDEDRLGLDSIYIQAKRWQGIVGRPELQKFVGALQGQRAHKGVFITTSDFTKEAQDYENNLGVSVTATYDLKKIDSDYFSKE
jgi:restriction system protein